MMSERLHFDPFLIPMEPGFPAFILPERVEFVEEKPAFGLQGPRGFGEYKGEILYVFQHKVADDQVKRLVIKDPSLGDVHLRKTDVLRLHLLPGFLDHPVRKIHGKNGLSDLRQERCVLACPAAELQDRPEM